MRPPDRDLDRVADLIAKGERTAIFGGAGCIDARAEVLQLSQLLSAPVGFTFRGKDILEAANPNAVGMTGLLGWGGAYAAINVCDLLLMLGTDFPYHPFMPEKSTIVQIDEQAVHLGRRAKVDIGLVGDVRETLKALLPRLQQRSGRDFLDKILAIHNCPSLERNLSDCQQETSQKMTSRESARFHLSGFTLIGWHNFG